MLEKKKQELEEVNLQMVGIGDWMSKLEDTFSLDTL